MNFAEYRFNRYNFDMPSHNIIRYDVAGAYYHVYARGASKQPIFLDVADWQHFLDLFQRYLSGEPTASKTGRHYPDFQGRISLVAYCLMGNHFHLFLQQHERGDLTAFMRSLMTSYSRYFNLRHKRTGSLFESRFKASIVDDDAYMMHISRYIHLNPRSWKYYAYSSIDYYRHGREPKWLDTVIVLDNFADRKAYIDFLSDYESYKQGFDEIKHDLADQ